MQLSYLHSGPRIRPPQAPSLRQHCRNRRPAALTEELAALAAWLGLEGLRIEHRGDLTPALAAKAEAGRD